MGMTAEYFMVDEITLSRLRELAANDPDDLAEAVFELEESGVAACDIDMLWDGLHFLFTGRSASSPEAGNPLSEAVVGLTALAGGEETDFTAYTPHAALAPIISALEALDWRALRESFSPDSLAWSELYPKIWHEDPDALFKELQKAAEELLDFYRGARRSGNSVVLTIA